MAWATAGGLELRVRYRGNVAAFAVLACAVVLMVSPPLIAVISMVDPDALTNLSRWLERLSPAFTYLDYAKAAVTIGSIALVWRVQRTALEAYRTGSGPVEGLVSDRRVAGVTLTGSDPFRVSGQSG